MKTAALMVSLLVMLVGGTDLFAATASITSIKIAPGGSKVEIQGDQPLTYLYRKTAGGGIMLDIAPGKTVGIAGEMPGNGNITGIWIKELQVDGIPVTRLVIGLEKDAVAGVNRDPSDPGRILVTFPNLATPGATVPGEPVLTELLEPQDTKPVRQAGESVAKTLSVNIPAAVTPGPIAAEVPAVDLKPPPVPVAPSPPIKTATAAVAVNPAPTASVRPVLESIAVNRDSVEIVTGSGFPQYNSFRLSSPNRLVVDLPGAGISLKTRDIIIGKFGVSKIRIGIYADKVRLVFDSQSVEGVPMNVIRKTDKGLVVSFAAK